MPWVMRGPCGDTRQRLRCRLTYSAPLYRAPHPCHLVTDLVTEPPRSTRFLCRLRSLGWRPQANRTHYDIRASGSPAPSPRLRRALLRMSGCEGNGGGGGGEHLAEREDGGHGQLCLGCDQQAGAIVRLHHQVKSAAEAEWVPGRGR